MLNIRPVSDLRNRFSEVEEDVLFGIFEVSID